MNKRITRNGITVLAKSYASYRDGLLAQRTDKGSLCDVSIQLATFDAMVIMSADMLENDNENFDRDRFMHAVYGTESKE